MVYALKPQFCTLWKEREHILVESRKGNEGDVEVFLRCFFTFHIGRARA
jgi:hypothetical protein